MIDENHLNQWLHLIAREVIARIPGEAFHALAAQDPDGADELYGQIEEEFVQFCVVAPQLVHPLRKEGAHAAWVCGVPIWARPPGFVPLAEEPVLSHIAAWRAQEAKI